VASNSLRFGFLRTDKKSQCGRPEGGEVRSRLPLLTPPSLTVQEVFSVFAWAACRGSSHGQGNSGDPSAERPGCKLPVDPRAGRSIRWSRAVRQIRSVCAALFSNKSSFASRQTQKAALRPPFAEKPMRDVRAIAPVLLAYGSSTSYPPTASCAQKAIASETRTIKTMAMSYSKSVLSISVSPSAVSP